jgi:hypothetical protein
MLWSLSSEDFSRIVLNDLVIDKTITQFRDWNTTWNSAALLLKLEEQAEAEEGVPLVARGGGVSNCQPHRVWPKLSGPRPSR